MHKKTWIFVFIDAVLLVLLFLASSTDMILKERGQQSYKVTVMMDMEMGDEGENFKNGINKAAIDRYADVNIIQLAQLETVEEKIAVLQKEIENGSEGLILHCKNKKTAEEIIAAVPVGLPIVLYDTRIDSSRVRAVIERNLEEEVDLMTRAVLWGRKKGEDVILVETSKQNQQEDWLHNGLEEALTEEGIVVRRITVDDFSLSEALLKGLAAQGGNLLITADFSVLQTLAQTCESKEIDLPLYGIGWGNSIRSPLEKGYLNGVVACRSYEGGYLAVEKMANILENKGAGQEFTLLESQLITKDRLYDKHIESIVFPYA